MDGAGVATIGATSVVVLAKRSGAWRRVRWTATNTGAVNVTISFGDQAAVSGSGMVLQPGATIGDSAAGNYEPAQGNLNCVAGAASTLAWTEGLEVR